MPTGDSCRSCGVRSRPSGQAGLGASSPLDRSRASNCQWNCEPDCQSNCSSISRYMYISVEQMLIVECKIVYRFPASSSHIHTSLRLPYIVRPRSTLSFGATTTPPPPPRFTWVDCRFSNRSVRYSVDMPHAQSSKFGSLLGTTSSAHKGHIPCLFPTSFGG